MVNYVGTKLSRLIKERAYTAGSLPIMEDAERNLEAQLAAAKSKIQVMRKRLAELDVSITELSAIKPSEIRPVRPIPRKLTSKHGAFRRELIRFLKEADGAVETSDLFKHMIEKFNMPYDTSAERRRTRDLIRRPLYTFEELGAIMRMPTTSSQGYGVWVWLDNDVDESTL
jgi:hypothetical protein